MKNLLFAGLLLLLFTIGCNTEPEAINYGKDICEHCKMVIADEKYGAEIKPTFQTLKMTFQQKNNRSIEHFG